MRLYTITNSVMECRNHSKNAANPKNQMSRGIFLSFCMLLFTLGEVTAQSIKLNITEIELIVGEEQRLNATTNPAGQSVVWKSSDTSKATVEGNYGEAKVTAKAAGTVNISVTFRGQTVSCAIIIYEVFSQTGVTINGVTWATCNVDAPGTFAAKATDAGMLYQWNRKIGWSTTDPLTSSPPNHSWDISKPTGTTWEAVNDPCPTGWRVPTLEEMKKLKNAGHIIRKEGNSIGGSCVPTIVNGKRGRKFGTGNNIIFLPSTGYRMGGDWWKGKLVFSSSTDGEYWSSTEMGSNRAYTLNLANPYRDDNMVRENGFSVRCVKKQRAVETVLMQVSSDGGVWYGGTKNCMFYLPRNEAYMLYKALTRADLSEWTNTSAGNSIDKVLACDKKLRLMFKGLNLTNEALERAETGAFAKALDKMDNNSGTGFIRITSSNVQRGGVDHATRKYEYVERTQIKFSSGQFIPMSQLTAEDLKNFFFKGVNQLRITN